MMKVKNPKSLLWKVDNVNIITNDINHKIFEVEIKNKKFRYEYDFGWYKEKIHNIKPTCESDALETMLKKVLFKQADFESNCKRRDGNSF